jgi:hypothetical protein
MLNYKTQLTALPPPLNDMAAKARASLERSPYAGQSHQDVVRALGGRQAANLDAYARQAGEAYGNAAQQAQQALALSGLRMMAEGQQQQNNLANSRTQLLLRGLL